MVVHLVSYLHCRATLKVEDPRAMSEHGTLYANAADHVSQEI
jgi:hypothetical protein